MSEENEDGLLTCPVVSWIIGALLGFATYLILSGRYQTGTVVALIAALVVMGVVGFLLQRFFCRTGRVDAHPHHEPAVHEIATTPEAVAAVDNIVTGDMAMPYGIPETSPDEPMPTQAEGVEAAKEDSASKAKSAQAGEKPAPKQNAKPATAPKAKAASKPARKPVAADGKPELLTEARSGGADDLKQIKGVGPKMEKMLNAFRVMNGSSRPKFLPRAERPNFPRKWKRAVSTPRTRSKRES